MTFSRRDFVKTSLLGAIATGVGTSAQGENPSPHVNPQEHQQDQAGPHKRPIIVCAHNGYAYLDAGVRISERWWRYARCCAESRQRSRR